MAEKHRKRSNASIFGRLSSLVLHGNFVASARSSSTETNGQNGAANEKITESPQMTSLEKHADERDRRRWARTVPPWIHSLHEGESLKMYTNKIETTTFLPSEPLTTRAPQRNHVPAPNARAARGRQFDHARSSEPQTCTSPVLQGAGRWRAFINASAYPYQPDDTGLLVNERWRQENLPDLDLPWAPGFDEDNTPKDLRPWLLSSHKRSRTASNFQRQLMRNAFVPLIIRLLVMTFAGASLALGAYIYRESERLNTNPAVRAGTESPNSSNSDYICVQQPSTYMAFIVETIAVLYLFYITYDEYFNKPLGQRRARDKLRLLFLDLVFIIFSSANLSLAFNTLTDQQWACFAGNTAEPNNSNNEAAARSTCVYSISLCRRQRALCGVLVVALVAWVLTFTISILRVVERVSR